MVGTTTATDMSKRSAIALRSEHYITTYIYTLCVCVRACVCVCVASKGCLAHAVHDEVARAPGYKLLDASTEAKAGGQKSGQDTFMMMSRCDTHDAKKQQSKATKQSNKTKQQSRCLVHRELRVRPALEGRQHMHNGTEMLAAAA